MSKRTASLIAALGLVLGGAAGFAWHAPGRPTTWIDVRTWAGFGIVIIGPAIALTLAAADRSCRPFGGPAVRRRRGGRTWHKTVLHTSRYLATSLPRYLRYLATSRQYVRRQPTVPAPRGQERAKRPAVFFANRGSGWPVLAISRFAMGFRLARARTGSWRPRQGRPRGKDRTCPRWRPGLARAVTASSAPAACSARSSSATARGLSRLAWPAGSRASRAVTASLAPASRSSRSSSATPRGSSRLASLAARVARARAASSAPAARSSRSS